MKKLFYILGIGLLMASCTEDFKDWADPQSNTENGKSATATAVAAGAIDFTAINTDSIQLFTPTYTIEEGVTASNQLTIYGADKSEGIAVATDEFGRVKASDLRDAIEKLYGVTEGTFEVPFNVFTTLTDNGQAFSSAGDLVTNVTMAAGVYMVVDGVNKAMELSGDNQYTITVNVPKVDNVKQSMSFHFLPFNYLSNEAEGKLGSSEETYGFIMGGNLAQGADAFEIKLDPDDEFNQYTITVNTSKMTYEIGGIAYADMIWQAGNANGWGSHAAGLKNQGWKAPKNDGDYYGFMYLNGEFKFRSQQNSWDAPDWGIGASEGTLAVQSGNLSADAGFYMVNANLANMTYSLTPITTIGVIGGFNGWASDYVKLQYNTATGAWEGNCDIPAGTEFKFRANDGWDINWGGDINNLSFDGGNITLDTSANYFIQLYITYQGDFHVVFTPVIN